MIQIAEVSLIVCRLNVFNRYAKSMEIKKDFGKKVRHLRLANGWSQEELANRAGLHRTYISDIERGNRNPTLSVIYEVASALEVDIAALFRDS